MTFNRARLLLAIVILLGGRAQRAAAEDWPMWGRTPQRHMVSPEKNPPTDWDVESGKNIKWKAAVGSKSYGNPVVAGGLVFVGSNNEAFYDKKITADGGNELCFRESDGKFLWQHYNAKLAAGRVNDWPQEGLCATAFVEGDRLYYPSNRCEVWCWDISPLRSAGGDGALPKEVWHVDMMSKLGVFPHNMTSSAMVSYKDFVYAITGNGVDDTHKNIPAPNAPAIVCFNKKTGEVVWTSNVPGENILHGRSPRWAMRGSTPSTPRRARSSGSSTATPRAPYIRPRATS
jgi:outer membrane protein assembly factor BamB